MFLRKKEKEIAISHMPTPVELPRMKSIIFDDKEYELPKLKL
jgi:hypothetical protein